MWFLLTNLGLPVFTIAAPHPGCPCGCQGSDECGKETAETSSPGSCCRSDSSSNASCCRKARQEAGCCSQKATAASSCCSSSKPNEETQLRALCRCGKSGHDLLSLTKSLDIPPAVPTIIGPGFVTSQSFRGDLKSDLFYPPQTPPPERVAPVLSVLPAI
ncbi:hypothetical protein [Rubinisphaera margarita]|uniref:hypothetical protein n=1 Tax=Rubinisphaera margarita TaxID=2909586 RepID=UPI001EE96C63|nr:hypothetical protein [Rubinisphaera margarita]MCG6154224.1 hypothetical protein [Rubinisphaera margarita]